MKHHITYTTLSQLCFHNHKNGLEWQTLSNPCCDFCKWQVKPVHLLQNILFLLDLLQFVTMDLAAGRNQVLFSL